MAVRQGLQQHLQVRLGRPWSYRASRFRSRTRRRPLSAAAAVGSSSHACPRRGRGARRYTGGRALGSSSSCSCGVLPYELLQVAATAEFKHEGERALVGHNLQQPHHVGVVQLLRRGWWAWDVRAVWEGQAMGQPAARAHAGKECQPSNVSSV